MKRQCQMNTIPIAESTMLDGALHDLPGILTIEK